MDDHFPISTFIFLFPISSFPILSPGHCKTWTVDSGLDRGLRYGLLYGLHVSTPSK